MNDIPILGSKTTWSCFRVFGREMYSIFCVLKCIYSLWFCDISYWQKLIASASQTEIFKFFWKFALVASGRNVLLTFPQLTYRTPSAPKEEKTIFLRTFITVFSKRRVQLWNENIGWDKTSFLYHNLKSCLHMVFPSINSNLQATQLSNIER